MAYTYDIRAMLRRFGVVTVMDVKGYEAKLFAADRPAEGTTVGAADYKAAYSQGEWDAASTLSATTPLFHLDTLKIANINQEGPTKTITGGQNADTLLKYGKTVTIEMQEALGKYDVLEHIYGINYSVNAQIAAITDRFPQEITLVGTTFVIDQATGAKQPVKIVIPRFLGDGIFNLTQDAEGDATVFDLNGNVLRFEGGVANTDTPIAITTLPEKTATGDTVANSGKALYNKGADNQFYFIATEEGFEQIKALGYREAWLSTDKAAAAAGGSTPSN
jgi:hypothetical protein